MLGPLASPLTLLEKNQRVIRARLHKQDRGLLRAMGWRREISARAGEEIHLDSM